MNVYENEESSTESKPKNEWKDVRVLILEDGLDGCKTICQLDKGTCLQFRVGPSLFGCQLEFYTNYPVIPADGAISQSPSFQRNRYSQLKWKGGNGDHISKNETEHGLTDTAYVEIFLQHSGSFQFYFESKIETSVGGCGYFIVNPTLKSTEVIPMDAIQCESVISKLMGPLSGWSETLKPTIQCGYNMIHWTPVQLLGGSNSAYCLRDQRHLNASFKCDWTELENFLAELKKSDGVLSICDVVLNHTSDDSNWIKQHPEATYNCWNSPHLRPAFMFDRLIAQLTADIGNGKWIDRGIPRGEVSNDKHLNVIRCLLYDHYLPQLKMVEYFMLDVDELLSQFKHAVLHSNTNLLDTDCQFRNSSFESDGDGSDHTEVFDNEESIKCENEICIIQDPEMKRFTSIVDMELALKAYNLPLHAFPYCENERDRLQQAVARFKLKLEDLNRNAYNETWQDLNAAVENVISGARYERVSDEGPKLHKCDRDHPLVCPYFYTPKDVLKEDGVSEIEEMVFENKDTSSLFMAYNGWVMGHDPLVNFAEAPTKTYLRRELVAWGDCIKLRYGDCPDDSPFLWQYMKEYCEQTSQIFDGLRLDNCHSTPLHVAQYLVDACRVIRPELYVTAELFTSSEQTDNVFVNKLGINSLIREAMSASDSHDLGRLVHRFGGSPVGAFMTSPLDFRILDPKSTIAHAIFYDQTHDNKSECEMGHSSINCLPTAALVNMSACASASNRGYDHFVPHHINVVKEGRKYIKSFSGMCEARKVIHEIHTYLANEGFSQIFVDQMSYDVVAVTRHNPVTHESMVCVCHTAFSHKSVNDCNQCPVGLRNVEVEGVLKSIPLEAKIRLKEVDVEFRKNDEYINGLQNMELIIQKDVFIDDSKMARRISSPGDDKTVIQLNNLTPGSVIYMKFELHRMHFNASQNLQSVMKTLTTLASSLELTQVPDEKGRDLIGLVSELDLCDLNHVLFRCDDEEREMGCGGVYSIDGYGPLKYAGLQGFVSILDEIRPSNDLGNYLPSNLRNGDWALDYISNRLVCYPRTRGLGSWVNENIFHNMKKLPRYLIPKYFDSTITLLYKVMINRVWNQMSPFIRDSSSQFIRKLALSTVQHMGCVSSAVLPDFETITDESSEKLHPTLAAGLPHFCTGYMRSWGRDTFISLRGSLILNGRMEEAKNIILGYASTMRHGLIPNLLDCGRNARFNARDAVWWWMHATAVYATDASNSSSNIFDERVIMSSGSDFEEGSSMKLEDLIQHALQTHFSGLKFREKNAGIKIDEHMKDEGFNNEIGVDKTTGFVYGGNKWNCGTWMDKMGSSKKAGNGGRPATPRDGSAVEIVGLCYATLRMLSDHNKSGLYSHKSVKSLDSSTEWSYDYWANVIQQNFEKYFHINRENNSTVENRPDLINKNEIYKDTLNATSPWCDYQLRCNFPITMAIAPSLFTPEKALLALNVVRRHLYRGGLGLATLDPDDWSYKGNYDNSNNSDDESVAHGFNYHQGPEWVWPLPFFLRAYLHFSKIVNNERRRTSLTLNDEGGKQVSSRGGGEADCDSKLFVMSTLSKHYGQLLTSPWRGLTELTNADGAICPDSNPTQAWSVACVLELLYDMRSR